MKNLIEHFESLSNDSKLKFIYNITLSNQTRTKYNFKDITILYFHLVKKENYKNNLKYLEMLAIHVLSEIAYNEIEK